MSGPSPRKSGTRRESEAGQSVVEYALILALVAIVAIVTLTLLGEQISGVLSKLGETLSGGAS
jgi:Flp pilus assembly pilin Flp